jgi:hypothetical protein
VYIQKIQTRLSANTNNDNIDLPKAAGVGLDKFIQNSRLNIEIGANFSDILIIIDDVLML